MSYLLCALLLFCLIHIKNSFIYIIFSFFLLLYFIKIKQFNKLMIILSIFLSSFLIRNINIESSSYVGVVIEAKENYYLFSSFKGRFYIYEKDNLKEEGDVLKLKGKRSIIEDTSVESQFSFQKFLNNKGYYYQLFVKEEQMLIKSLLNKKNVLKKYESNLNTKSFELFKSVVFGMNSSNNYFYEISETLHFYSILTVGGYFFSKLKNKTYKYKIFNTNLIFYLFLIPFILLRPTRFLYIRIIIHDVINKILSFKKLRTSLLKKTGIEMIFILLINPFYAFQTSFILSYGISILINLIVPLVKYKKSFKKKLIIQILLNLVFFLNSWFNDYEVNLMLPLLNLLTPFLLVMQFIIVIFSFTYFYSGIEFISNIYRAFLNLIDGLKININLGYLSIFSLCILLFLIVLILIQIAKNNKKHLKNITFITSICVLLLSIPYQKFESSITFINVGQGDSILLRNRGKVLMIDTGGSKKFDIVKESLIPYFKKNQIAKIDYLITTHNDYDHIGGKETLINKGYVQNIIDYNYSFPFYFTNIKIDNINKWKNSAKDENDKSLVLSFSFLNKKFLLMGDASKEVEKKIMDVNSNLKHDIIKLGHHGSNTSSSKMFLIKVSPSVAIISCGKNNSYGHPHQDVLDILDELDIEVKRTDIDGTIKFYSH